MFFQIIETSSAANCAFVECGNVRFLIDAGVGIKKTREYLSKKNLDLDGIDAVFITHEHGDHCRALQYFRACGAEIFANQPTAECIWRSFPETKWLNWKIFSTGEPFEFAGIKVSPFSVPHDASDAVGYGFDLGGKNLVWATDMGKTTLPVRYAASRAQILVLESNYCPRMLDNSARSPGLKKRIKGSHGHLSNSDAVRLLESLDAAVVDKVYLAHISRECNSIAHIKDLLSEVPSPVREKIEIVPPLKESLPFSF